MRSSLDQRVKDLENAGSGVDQFTELTDVPASYASQGGKYVRVDIGETKLEFVTLAGGGDLLSTNNLSDLSNVSTARTNLGLNTTANQTDSTDKRFMTDAQEAKLDAITGTNTGDQTSIVGITGTKAQFDTACTDGNFLYSGDVTQYTDEMAQDAVGAMVDTTLVYTDTTPLLSRAALTGAITASAGSNTTSLGSFTTAQLNTALSDNDIATGGGTASGTNTGDETTATIKTKLGAAATAADGYLTSTDWNTFNGKQAALTNPVTGTGTNNEIAAFNSTGSTITSLSTATYPSLTELSYVKGVTSAVQTQLNGKEPTITNGFGITGTSTKAVSLTNSQAFCTATTSISAATYADITGASITLAAGTWLIMATANVYAANTAFIAHIAITDGANTVIAEGSQGMPASGTASVNQWGNVSLSAIVTPAGSTTYKLRGARGNTTITGTYTVADGAGTGTTNNTTDNTDKGTVIMAVRIA